MSQRENNGKKIHNDRFYSIHHTFKSDNIEDKMRVARRVAGTVINRIHNCVGCFASLT